MLSVLVLVQDGWTAPLRILSRVLAGSSRVPAMVFNRTRRPSQHICEALGSVAR